MPLDHPVHIRIRTHFICVSDRYLHHRKPVCKDHQRTLHAAFLRVRPPVIVLRIIKTRDMTHFLSIRPDIHPRPRPDILTVHSGPSVHFLDTTGKDSQRRQPHNPPIFPHNSFCSKGRNNFWDQPLASPHIRTVRHLFLFLILFQLFLCLYPEGHP